MSVGAVNKQTGDRIPTAGMPAIDDALDLTSVNPVQNAIITAALANKQDKTDNNLETTAKTIVGAINENAGDIDSLKSGFTNLDNEVNGDATTYPYADVITIEDAVPANLAECNVKIEPVQDLHGYDKPWVGGAGKNKLPLVLADIKTYNTTGTWTGDTYSYNGVTIACESNQEGYLTKLTVNGTPSSAIAFRLLQKSLDFASGSLASGLTGGSWETYLLEFVSSNYDNRTYVYGGSVELKNTNVWIIELTLRASVQFTNLVCQPMIRLATETDATFAPYTNICPINGHTEVDVQRDGKNLFNINYSYINRQGAGGTYNISGNSITVTSSTQTSAFAGFIKPLEVGETYTISYTSTSKIRILQIDEPISVITQGYYGTDTDSGTSFVASKPYVLINCVGDTSGVTYSNIQLEKGSSATDYEPFKGKTYTLALGDTIYGGTVDFDSGVMTVTKATTIVTSLNMNNATSFYKYISPEPKSSLFTVNEIICEQTGTGDVSNVNTVFINSGGAFRLNTAQSFNTAEAVLAYFGGGLTVCYDIKDPFTVQLTPQQIQLLQGTNTLYASTGDISVTVNGVSGAIGSLTSDKQDKTDYALETTEKTVVGGINELKDRVKVIEVTTSDTVDQGTTVQVPTGYDAAKAVIVGYTAQRTNNLWYNADDHVVVGMYSEYLYVVPKNTDVLERTVKVVLIKFSA